MGVVRDLTTTNVTKQVLLLLAKLLSQFQDNKLISTLRVHCCRVLNCYLVRTPK